MFLVEWPGGSWEATARIAIGILVVYLVIIWAALVFWTYRDIRQRSRDPIVQTVAIMAVLVFSFPGHWIYLVLRPRYTLTELYERSLEEEALLQELEDQKSCPTCKRRVHDQYLVCPSCRTQLKEPCQSCGQPLSYAWLICPYCAAEKPPRSPAPPRPAAAPVGRAAPAGRGAPPRRPQAQPTITRTATAPPKPPAPAAVSRPPAPVPAPPPASAAPRPNPAPAPEPARATAPAEETSEATEPAAVQPAVGEPVIDSPGRADAESAQEHEDNDRGEPAPAPARDDKAPAAKRKAASRKSSGNSHTTERRDPFATPSPKDTTESPEREEDRVADRAD